jgi:hypothetical protein
MQTRKKFYEITIQKGFHVKTEETLIIILHDITFVYFHLTQSIQQNMRRLQCRVVTWCLYSININRVSFAFENGLN